MTEDEAKTTQCCGPVGCGRHPDGVPERVKEAANGQIEFAMILGLAPRFCIASACMAWRWGIQHPGGGWMQFVPREAMTPEQIADPKSKLGGYCGLAGKP